MMFFRRLFRRRALESDTTTTSSNTPANTAVPCHKVLHNMTTTTTTVQYVLCLNGSFNPVHTEHISMLESAKEQMESLGHTVVGGFLSPSSEDYVNSKKGDDAMTLLQRAHLIHLATTDSSWLSETYLGECWGKLAAEEVLCHLLNDKQIAALATANGIRLHVVQVMGLDTLVRHGFAGGADNSNSNNVTDSANTESKSELSTANHPIISIVAVRRPGTEIGEEEDHQTQALRQQGIVVASRNTDMSEEGVSSSQILQLLREGRWDELAKQEGDGSGQLLLHPKVLEWLRKNDSRKGIRSGGSSSSSDAVHHHFVLSSTLRDRVYANLKDGTQRNDFPSDIVEANRHIISDRHLAIPPTTRFCDKAQQIQNPTTTTTKTTKTSASLCVVKIDTISAALALGDDTCILNFANAEIPGGLYEMNMPAQEEDVCRLCPQLYPALVQSNLYPIEPYVCLITPDIQVLRYPGTYDVVSENCLGTVTVLTAAMPMCDGKIPEGGWLSDKSEWCVDVRRRVQTVLHAAASTGKRNVVLGAWGCGVFGNDPVAVATVFKEEMDRLLECEQCFDNVVFAILGKNMESFETTFFNEYKLEVKKNTCKK